MRPTPSNERGSSSRAVLVALALVLALIGVIAFFALRGDPTHPSASAEARPAAPSAPVDDSPAAEDTLARTDTVGANVALVAGGIPIPVGVRLGGPGRLIGRVLDRTTGQGVAGARVDLLPLPPVGQEFFGRMLRLAKTGAAFSSRVEPIAVTGTSFDGSFVFEGVRTGTYYIDARGTQHVPDSVARARVAASGDGGPIDVWLRPGGRLIGVVLKPDGEPAADVQVSMTQGPGLILEAARTGDACYLETRTDSSGGFVLCGVPPGDGIDLTATGSSFAISHALDLVVRAGEDTEVVLRTKPGCSVEGRVVSAPPSDAEDAHDDLVPVAGADVAIVPRGLRDLAYAEELLHQTHCVTDATGHFTMQHVPAGELDLVAYAEGHLPAKGPRITVGEVGLVSAPDFDLPRGPTVSGRVVDPAGQPLAGVAVRWNAVDFRNFDFDFSFAPLLTQAVEGFDFPVTDADGRFTAGAFAGDPPYKIDFFKSGFEQSHHEWKPDEEKHGFEVVMHRGGAIEGIVMDKKKRAPVTSFTIETGDRVETEASAPGNMNPFSGGILFEDPKGHFLLDPVKAEKIDLTFHAPGYLATELKDVEILEGETKRGVIVELEPGATLVGTVVDADGKPVAGAQVFALPADQATRGGNGRSRGRRGPPELEELPPGFRDFAAALGLLGDRAVLTTPDGRFELRGLEPGPTVAFAAHRSYVIGKSDAVTLSVDGPPAEVEIEMSTGAGVFGKALDRFGRPVAGAIVIAASPANLAGESRANGGGLYQSRTNASGEYRIERMVAGGYFLVLTRGDEALNPLSFLGTLNFDLVTVPEDELVEYDITDTSSGATRVFGRVLAGGEPVSRGNIAALGFESESVIGVDFKLAQIKADATYEFVGLAPGEYQFNVDNARVGGKNVRAKIVAEIPDVPEYRLDLTMPEGAVAGRIVDAASGERIAGADVTLRSTEAPEGGGWLGKMISQESGQERESSDDDGVFRFERLQAGEYELVARSPRWRDDAKRYAPCEPLRVIVRENRATDGVEIKLVPALELAGRVAAADGQAVAKAELIATRTDAQGTLPERAASDEEGAFRFKTLARGTYDVSASADGFASKTAKGVAVDAEHTAPLQIELARGVEVSIKVLAAGGQPISGATGRLARKGEAQVVSGGDLGRAFDNLFSGKGVSGSNGVLALGSYEAGEYVLQVQRGTQRVEQDVKLEAGGPVELRVHLN